MCTTRLTKKSTNKRPAKKNDLPTTKFVLDIPTR